MSDKPTDPDATVPDRPNAPIRQRPSRPPERYEPGAEIARGGMGRVALATDTLLERTVAIKQALTLDPEMLRRFERETKITARLEHPSIVPVYDAGTDGEAPFYVMRRVSGRPLSELISSSTTLDSRIALVPNLLAAAQAIAHAHARGIVHRDLKPSNILVGDLGETVVIDWGLAKVVGEPDEQLEEPITAGDSLRTRVGTVFGTPGFMSPGQLRGDPVGYSADVYALGASLYFVLAGKPPHHAKTGEAMMALASEGPPTPLAELVPGVPRELATIVETALAYGETTYVDASAFAEDLRRFSTGQLVAAHHYSRRERIVRFIRKHRAALAIAVVAAAVIAIGATLSVRRILEESERANAEAADATQAKRQAQERADQLLLIRARMLVEQNPTEALALLKDLDPSSYRTSEAQSLATGAIMRGVPWGMKPPDSITAMVQLDPTGDFMVQTTITGELYVWDLVHRTKVLQRSFKFGVRGVWVGRRILVHGSVATVWLDPQTNTLTPTTAPVLRHIEISDDQNVIIAITDDTFEAVQFDRELSRRISLWPGHKARWTSVAGTGAWSAVVDGTDVVVFARDGKEITRHTGKFTLTDASRANKLAAYDDNVLWELEVDTQTWTKLDTSKFNPYLMSFGYRNEELQIAMGSGHMLAYRDHRLVEVTRSPGLSFYAPVGSDDYVYLVSQNELVYEHRWGYRRIPLPQVLSNARIAGRRGVDRMVIVSGEVILIYDLDSMRPHEVTVSPQSAVEFCTPTTLLISDDQTNELKWFDIDTGRTTVIDQALPSLQRRFSYDPALGIGIHTAWRGSSTEIHQLRLHSKEAKRLYSGPMISAFALLQTGKLMIVRGKEIFDVAAPDHPIAALDSNVFAIHERGPDGFVATSYDGELVRGVPGGRIERIRVTPPSDLLRRAPNGNLVPPHISVSPAGEIFVGWGVTVWKWTDHLEPFWAFGAALTDLLVIANKLLVTIPHNRSVMVDLATRIPHGLPPHGGDIVTPAWKRDALAMNVGEIYHFVDLDSYTTWPSTIPRIGVSPVLSEGGRHAVIRMQNGLVMWNVPLPTGPLKPRLDAVTNALVNREGLLTWPWLN